MKVLIVGAGAIGIVLAVRLHRAGHDVMLGMRDAAAAKRYPAVSTAIDASGAVEEAPIAAVHPRSRPKAVDVLVIATKCDDAPGALKTWSPCLRKGGAAVCLQNGVIGDDVAASAGDALVECTVAFPATLEAPGRSVKTGPGDCILGPWPDGRMQAATPTTLAASVFADAVPTRIHMNMQGVKWTKLLINSAITGLGAMTGVDLGTLIKDRRARDAFIAIVTEGYAAGTAEGVRFEKVAGFHPDLVRRRTGGRLERAKAHLVLKVMGRRFRRQRSSSLQSLERGRRTEVHHINGHIVAAAQRHGLPAPVNAAVTATVARIEAGTAAPSLDHLDALP